jgi:hypothetical protein
MTGAEIRMTYTTTKCCNKLNCIQNLICGGGPSDFSSSSSNSRFDNSLYCQQIGVMPEEIPALAFDQFLKEIRQPFHALQAGAGSDEEASKQLRKISTIFYISVSITFIITGNNHGVQDCVHYYNRRFIESY